ncbi:unnamed protein product [Pleuronectes platessa]|uniref:Uncharacterized protein n=1 Tax=Pleuronectes platessa TaxID=8262 RepID=A0A9N7Z2X2_PLEPL|nr:unnamed protein product [Pleuronectes platessa]
MALCLPGAVSPRIRVQTLLSEAAAASRNNMCWKTVFGSASDGHESFILFSRCRFEAIFSERSPESAQGTKLNSIMEPTSQRKETVTYIEERAQTQGPVVIGGPMGRSHFTGNAEAASCLAVAYGELDAAMET